MDAKAYFKRENSRSDTAFEPTHTLQWIVRDDAELEAELNEHSQPQEDISQQVVDKVVDRIKRL